MDNPLSSSAGRHSTEQGFSDGRLTRSKVALLAACCAASVANVYYAQPLLDAIARDFRITHADVGGVITATQVGCAIALIFVVPLGDLLNRKRLIVLQLILLALSCVGVAVSSSPWMLLAGMVGLGLLGTAMTQGLIAYSATLAAPAERGRVVGAAQGGVVIGLLLARTLAGCVADVAGWRAVYFTSACIAVVMLTALSRGLPVSNAPRAQLAYGALLRSMGSLLLREKTLQIRGVLAMLMFAAFSTFWSALVLPLSAAPWSMSHTEIGAFGLVGAMGALAAARAGRLADRGYGQLTTFVALMLLLAAWGPLFFTTRSILLLIVGIVLLDIGGSAIHVVNQSMIFSARPEVHARLVGCYMLFYSVGSGVGAIASTSIYARSGWGGVCALGAGVSLVALVFWAVTVRRGARSVEQLRQQVVDVEHQESP
jgi:predicted MFS family arabinose efflux permease